MPKTPGLFNRFFTANVPAPKPAGHGAGPNVPPTKPPLDAAASATSREARATPRHSNRNTLPSRHIPALEPPPRHPLAVRVAEPKVPL
jgi:hypothetical protein